MRSGQGLIVCAAIGAMVVAERHAAAADRDHGGARWYIDVTGDRVGGCAAAADREAFEHEAKLACAAMGTCTVVSEASKAELVATLHCYGYREAWNLELSTIEGTLVSSTELAGARDDRFREAAMEIARDQAPEGTLAAATLRNTLPDGDKSSRPWKLPKMSLAFGPAAGFGGVEKMSGGVHALLGMSIANSANLTFGMTGLMGGSESSSARHLRSGIGFSFGAPFAPTWIGAAFEGGIDVSQSYQTESFWRSAKAQTHAGPYGQGGLVLAAPLRWIRPYLGFAVGAYAEPVTQVYALFDAGIALPLF